MKHHDEAIEKVLAGLGRVEVPQGLERRTLKGARDRVERRSRSPWRQWRKVTSALVYGFVLAIVGIFGGRHRPGSGKALPEKEVARTLPMAGPQQIVPRLTPVRLKAPARPVRNRMRRDQGVRVEDLVALAEMRAPSESAPPLPMTEQEKMLLRIVHRGDPEEIALLSPEMRLRQDAEGNAEFQRFFRPSRTKANQNHKPQQGDGR